MVGARWSRFDGHPVSPLTVHDLAEMLIGSMVSPVEATMLGRAILPVPGYLNRSKLRPPPPQPSVPRPRLMSRLDAISRSKLALLWAEAGYGKTTLLLDFLQRWPHVAVWYHLGETDREAARFLSYLVAGIAEQSPEMWDEAYRGILRRTEGAGGLESPHLLLHELCQLAPRPLLLVLDNFEAVVPSRAVCDLVSDLLEYSGPEMHVAIASRVAPPLPVARLEARREALVMGSDDLAFDLQETRELLVGLQGARVTEAQLDTIWHRTEGWPAGLVMVAEMMRNCPSDAVIASLEDGVGPPEVMCRYFVHEVFREQGAELQDFLVRTSILKTLAHDVINDLLEIDHGGELLSAARQGGVFTRAADAAENVQHYHPLFRAFLLRKLHALYRNQHIQDLYARAGRAACRHGYWSDAVAHYAVIGDWAEVGELVERAGDQLMRQGFLDTVQQWLALMPEEVIAGRPALLRMRGRLLREAGRFHEALRDLDGAARGAQDGTDRGSAVLTQIEIANVHDVLGEFEKAEAALSAALPRTGDDAVLRSRVLAGLSVTCIDSDELQQAARLGEMAIAQLESAVPWPGSSLPLARALRFCGRALIFQGELSRGLQYASRSVDLCRANNLGGRHLSWSLLTLGQGLTLQGAHHDARRILDEAESLAHECYPLVNWIWVWRGNAHRNAGDLDQAERDYGRAVGDHLRPGRSACVGLAFLRLRQGRADEGLLLSGDALRSCPAEESPGERAAYQAAYGMALAAVGDRGPALQNMAAAAEIFRQRGRGQQLASVQWHVARAMLEEGRRAEALENLKEAILWASARGIYHLWWWNPETVAGLWPLALQAGLVPAYLLELARRRLGPAECRFLYPALDSAAPGLRAQLIETLSAVSRDAIVRLVGEDLLDSCPDPMVRQRVSSALASGVLAPQELAYLRGEAGLTWREIDVLALYYLRCNVEPGDHRFRRSVAEELVVSEETLKVHIHSIRRKLNLPDRRRSIRLPLAMMMHPQR